MLFLSKKNIRIKIFITLISFGSNFTHIGPVMGQSSKCINYWINPQTNQRECLGNLSIPSNSRRSNHYNNNYRNKFIEPKTGVEIIWKIDSDIFPIGWSSEPKNMQATSLSSKEIKTHLAAVKKAIDKYPADLIKDRISKIYLVNNLKFKNTEIGGFYIGRIKTIYLNNLGTNKGYSDDFLESMFHHEFSSFLFHQYFNNEIKTKWLEANEPNFTYGNGKNNIDHYIEKQKSGINTNIIREDSLQQGFLNIYSQSNMENDFNEIAEHIFVDGNHVLELANKYPRLGKKVQLFIQLYSSINSKFTIDYFYSL